MFLFILLILLMVTTVLSLSYLKIQSTELAYRTNNIKAVHDCVHEYLPDLSRYYIYYDIGLLNFVTPLLFQFGSYNIWDFVKSFGSLWLPVMIFRCFTVCASIPTKTVNHMERNFGTWVKQSILGGDSDLMFSGHIATAFCFVLTMAACGIISSTGIWLFLLLMYSFFSSMTRSHYTIDVVIAWIVVPLFYDFQISNGSATKKLLLGLSRKECHAIRSDDRVSNPIK